MENETVWTWTEHIASPHSLAGFIEGAINAYPNKDQVVLSLVGHGSGWSPNAVPSQPGSWIDKAGDLSDRPDFLGGSFWDLHPGDSLSTFGLSTALDWAYTSTGQKIDLVYMDACSMAMSEVAYEIHDYADYFLASENTAWASFIYDEHINDIDGATTSRQIGINWLENEANAFRGGDYPFTMSLVDLNQMITVLTAEDALAQALIAELNNDLSASQALIWAAFQATALFESNYDGSIDTLDTYGDLYDFAVQIETQFTGKSAVINAAQSLQSAVLNAVIGEENESGIPWIYPDETWTWGTLGGLSKYLPFNLNHDEPRRRFYAERHLRSAADGAWDELIDVYWDGIDPDDNLSICPTDCDGVGEPLPLRPEVTLPSLSSDPYNVALHFNPSGAQVRAVDFTLDLTNSCLDLETTGNGLPDGITLTLPDGFRQGPANYNDMILNVSIADTESPYVTLENEQIATINFDTSACLPGANSVLTVTSTSTELNGNLLDEVTTSGTVEIPGSQSPVGGCEAIRDNVATDGSVIISGNRWTKSTAVSGFHGIDYLHNNNSGTGTAKFMAPGAGRHEAFIRWTEGPNRATNTPIDVVHAGGTETIVKNQQQDGGEWISLGTYTFGSDDFVEIRTDGTDGHVIADAVRFLPATCNEAQIYFSPSFSEIEMSELITIEVYATNMLNLYGVQLEMSFDPTVVEVVDASSGTPEIEIMPGTFLPADHIFHNNVDAGKIKYTASLRGKKLGVSGSGPIASILFRGLISGTNPLTFDSIALSDPQSLEIVHTHQNGEIRTVRPLTVPNSVDVAGQVMLERRGDNNNDGAAVCAGSQCTITDEAGSYALYGVPLTATVVITHQSYLSASYPLSGTPGEAITLPDVALRGGDYNQDGLINALDFSLCGWAWNSTPSDSNWIASADVTDDGVINVFDLVAVEHNWGQTAPAPWDSDVFSVVAASRRNSRPNLQLQATFEPNSNTLVSISPAESIARKGDTTETEIWIHDVNALYSFAIEIHFDPKVVQVTDIDPLASGVQIARGDFLKNQMTVFNKVDNQEGIIELGVTQTGPIEGQSGSGLLGKIPFQVVGLGHSDIQLISAQLGDDDMPNPQLMATNTKDSIVPFFAKYLPIIVR